MEDIELIKLILAGDKQKFRELISNHQNLVYGYLRKRNLSHEIAEELTQETFIKAYKKLGSFKQESKFSTWLVAIALNLFRNYYNSPQYRKDQERSLELEKVNAHSSSDPESSLFAKQQFRRFQQCFSQLSSKFSDVVSLILIKENSYQDAAEILHIPIGTVRSRLNSARLMLVTCINEGGAA